MRPHYKFNKASHIKSLIRRFYDQNKNKPHHIAPPTTYKCPKNNFPAQIQNI